MFYTFILRRSLAEDLRRIHMKLRFPFFSMEFMFLGTCENIGEVPFLT